MTPEHSPHAVLDELAGHPHGDDLARVVHTAAFAAADERRSTLESGLAELVDRAGLSVADAETRYGNAIRALERGTSEGAGSATRVLLATLLARGVALSPPEGVEAEGRVAEALVWLATYTSVDALTALDAALGERADGLWRAIATLVRRADQGALPQLGRAGAILAAAALRASASPAARAEAAALVEEVRDPIVRSLLRDALAPARRPSRAPDAADAATAEGGGAAGGDAWATGEPERASARLSGELTPPPRGPVQLVLLAVTGILFVIHLGRLAGRFLLRYRRPAALDVGPRGVTVRSRTELFGRVLRERETYIPVESLLRATREVRYPRLGLYAGLVALGLGTYVGVSLLVDGARAGSPELLGMGALVFAFGAALDFGLSHLGTASRGRCRVVLVPRKGPALALAGLERDAADLALARLPRV
ncbi:hypothetical protein SOCE26_043770 [Sorangium cellulosum]|uniref:Uncharacterized protein n=1 Tax=Sorangium cellulosum TaxID=56 RepID=A0A2L0EUG3_SORCE|nr:hypothetical protein [Sorangium cellulosum]AUX42937.1 hypothetical protein SOCE26_043770 [Sorangium cellulosum]